MLILIFIELLLSLLSCYYLILNCSSSFKLFKPFSSYSNLPNLYFSHSISTFPKFTRFTVSCCLSVETLYEVLATITIRCLRKLRMLGPDTVVSMEIGCWPSALSQTQKSGNCIQSWCGQPREASPRSAAVVTALAVSSTIVCVDRFRRVD